MVADDGKITEFAEFRGVLRSEVRVNDVPLRVLQKGVGPAVGYLGGFGGVPRWTPFLEELSLRYRVVVVSLPGFDGNQGHKELDTLLDWLLAARDLLVGAGLQGADLIGVSVGGALAADAAAVWPDLVRRLVLIAPFGIFDESEPTTDLWAQRPGALARLLCANPEVYRDQVERARAGDDSLEWRIMLTRASEAAIRYLHPFGETGLGRRLARIRQPTLVLRGRQDAVMPQSISQRIASGIGDNAIFREVDGAGHLADLDQASLVAEIIASFLTVTT